jgi:hypothetical protein
MTPQTQLAAALLDPALPCPPGLETWNGSDPARRVAIHRNNVMSSLIEALIDTYPVVTELVGEAFFRRMARCFVQAHPPRSPVLACYGGDFPAFVRGFPPAADLPWLAEVARLEQARVAVYHAADEPALERVRIAQTLTAYQFTNPGALTFALHPGLHCLRGQFAAVSLWAAHQGALRIETVDPFIAEHALVWRQALDVMVDRIDDGGLVFVERLARGQPLAAALTAALEEAPDFDAGARLGHLINAGLVTGLRCHEPTSGDRP